MLAGMKAIFSSLTLFCLAAAHGAESSGPSEFSLPDVSAIREELKAAGFAPIRPTGNPSTEAAHWLMWRTWVRRVLFTPMKANVAAAPWGADALAFVDKALNARFTPRWIEDASEALVPEARRLITAGADDAVFLWLAAEIIGFDNDHWGYAREVAGKARESFRKSRYPRVLGAKLYRQKADHMVAGYVERETSEALLKGAAYLLESLKEEGTWDAAAAPFFLNEIQEAYTGEVCRKNQEQFRPLFHPGRFPEWAEATLAGMWEVELGWHARGVDWAANVAGGKQEKFAAHLEKAAGHLRKAWELEPKQPFAACRMIAVAMAGGVKETPREWFDRSISACIDYSPAWTALNWSLRPRWGGSVRSMIAVGLAAAECGRFDTDAPFWLIHALDKAQEEMATYDECREIYRQPAVQAAMTGMCDGYFRNGRTAGEREHFAWWRALSGWLTGRHAAGEAALAQTGSRPAPPFVRYRLSRFLADEISLRGELALARTGGLVQWQMLETAYKNMDIGEASRMLAALPSPKAAAPLLARTTTLLDMEKKLAKGEWVKLSADPALSCWHWVTGRWRADPHGNLINSGEGTRALLTHRVKIGPSFEARGSFLCSAPRAENFDVGLALTHCMTASGHGNWTSAALLGHGGISAYISDRWYTTKIPARPVKLDHTKPLPWTVRVQEGRLTWTVNGVTVWEGESLTRDGNLGGAYAVEAPNGRFGFALHRSSPGVETTFAPVEIRRLP